MNSLSNIINQPRYKQADFLQVSLKPSKEEKKQATEKAKIANLQLNVEKKSAKSNLKELIYIIEKEARQLLKSKFSYPIFLYDAEAVGISATGDSDKNELYQNDNMPNDCDASALELYEQFLRRE